MSYKKAMKHACNTHKNKLTATRLRGNRLVFGITKKIRKDGK